MSDADAPTPRQPDEPNESVDPTGTASDPPPGPEVPPSPEPAAMSEPAPSPEPPAMSEPAASAEPPAMSDPYGVPVPVHPGVAAVASGPIGEVRETGKCILLTVVTLGFYSLYWYYKTQEEMKQHTGTGLGGPVALILAIFVGLVMPFFSSHEVGKLYERRGEQPPVTAMTGLWALLLGWFFLVGSIVWFVKTNGALNDYWRSLGAEGAEGAVAGA